MSKIQKWQIGRLYGLGSKLGLVEQGNKEDDFHNIIYTHTKKTSVADLTQSEFYKVQEELEKYLPSDERVVKKNYSKTAHKEVEGMMSKKQQDLAWKYVYDLAKLEPNVNTTVGKRMCGAIEKNCGVTAIACDPFRFVTSELGEKLIENLKRYVRSTKAKNKKKAQLE